MDDLVLLSLRRIPIPWGPDDGSDDADAGDAGDGSPSPGEKGNSGGDRGTPQKDGGDEDMPAWARRLEEQNKRLGNGLEQLRRKVGITRRGRDADDGDDDRGDGRDGDRSRGSDKRTDEEKREAARERRIRDLEQRGDKSQIRAELREGLDAIEDQLLKGARAKIEKVLRPGLRVHDGEVVYDTGDELITLAEAIETESKDPLYRPAKSREAGGGNKGGDKSAGDGGDKGFEDVDFDKMSDKDFERYLEKTEEGFRRKSRPD